MWRGVGRCKTQYESVYTQRRPAAPEIHLLMETPYPLLGNKTNILYADIILK